MHGERRAAELYSSSDRTLDMDVHIGDLHSTIVDREIEIVQELQERVLVYDQVMGHACDVCAELDCLIAFASASHSHDYRRPVMTDDNVIDIKQGRFVHAFVSCIALIIVAF